MTAVWIASIVLALILGLAGGYLLAEHLLTVTGETTHGDLHKAVHAWLGLPPPPREGV